MMHIILLLFLTTSVIPAKSTSLHGVNLNLFELLSVMFPDIGDWMRSRGFDYIDLPNITQSDYNLFLTSGLLSNLHEIAPHLETTVTYGNKTMHVDFGITFQKLFVHFDYEVTVLGFSPSGWIDGTIHEVEVHLNLRLNMTDMRVTLEHFESSIDSIQLELHGNRLYDWLANSILGIIEPIITVKLQEFMNVEVKKMVSKYLSAYS